MDVAGLVRTARREAALSQREVAERAGIGQSALSRYERGVQLPSITTLRAILAAAGKQVRADLEPLDADVQQAINGISEQPIDEREGAQTWRMIGDLDQVAHRVEGLAAASILGAPVPVGTFELALADESASIDWLATKLHSWSVRIRAPEWPVFRIVHLSDSELRETIAQNCADGWFELQVTFVIATVTLRPADVVADHVRVATSAGEIPVQPLHQIESDDPQAARILAVLRGEPPGTNAAAPGTAKAKRPAVSRRYDPLEDRWY